jgi:hypothetical protein
MSAKIAQEIPALLTANGAVSLVFEARTNGSVQAKYPAFDNKVVAQAGERAFRVLRIVMAQIKPPEIPALLTSDAPWRELRNPLETAYGTPYRAPSEG